MRLIEAASFEAKEESLLTSITSRQYSALPLIPTAVPQAKTGVLANQGGLIRRAHEGGCFCLRQSVVAGRGL